MLQESAEAFGGAPARLVVVRLNPKMSEEERKHVKEMKGEMRVWFDGGGCPIASESTMDAKVRFLVFKAEMHGRERREYARVGDRLIAVRDEQQTNGSGLGQHEESTTTVTVVPHPPGALVPPAPPQPAASPPAGATPAPSATPATGGDVPHR